MATGRPTTAAFLQRECARLTDAQLLDRFLSERDEGAFDVLVHRHGPMVLGVCRRVLADAHDADDAFQATFLILVRRAGSIRRRELVGSWLYGVAYRAALEARMARRRSRERQLHPMPEPMAPAASSDEDARSVLDEEIERLPERFRVPVVLCDVQGRTRREAAQLLGVPEGTVSGRLTTARRKLAQRLRRRGIVLSAAALAALLAKNTAAAAVPAPLAAATLNAMRAIAAGPAPIAGVVSAKVAALTEGVFKTMLLARLKSVLLVLLVAAALGGAGALMTYHGRTASLSPNELPGEDDPVVVMNPVGQAPNVPKTYGYLGVLVADNQNKGQVLVNDVFADSPAAQIGVKAGDVLVELGDKVVSDAGVVVSTMRKSKPGDKLPLRLQRADKEIHLTATLGRWPAAMQAEPQGRLEARLHVNQANVPGYLGVVLQDTDDNVVVIRKVAPDSPAAKAGIKADDILLTLDGAPVKHAKSLIERMAGLKAGDQVAVRLKRGDQELDVTVTAAERPSDFGKTSPPDAAAHGPRLDRFTVSVPARRSIS
jgi:RNA polymerase sigma factor (sigma-70 family)